MKYEERLESAHKFRSISHKKFANSDQLLFSLNEEDFAFILKMFHSSLGNFSTIALLLF